MGRCLKALAFCSMLPGIGWGQQTWAHTWGGSGNDFLSAVATDSSGNAYFAGYTSSFGAGGTDVLLLKYSSSGNLMWSRTWGGPNNEYGNGMAVDSSGNIYVAGGTSSFGAGSYDVFLLKFDTSGNLLWSLTWGGTSFDQGYDAAFDGSGNIYVAAESYSLGDSAVLLKFDPNGNLLSTRTWKGTATYDSAYSVNVDKNGNVVLTGTSWDYSVSPNHNSILILKFDSLGNFLWHRDLVSGAEDEAGGNKMVQFDASGNIFIAGHQAAVCQSSNFFDCNFIAEIAKLDPNGNLLWDKSWGGAGYYATGGATLDQNGNLVATGTTNEFLAGTNAATLLNFDTSGNLLQSSIWGGNGAVVGGGSVLDNGAILVTGSASNATGTWQSETAPTATLTPTLGTFAGTVGESSFTPSTPAGTVTEPTGAIDTGAGGTDALAVSTVLHSSALCNPPNSIFPDNSGAAGLSETTLSNQRMTGGLLEAEVLVQNHVRFWLSVSAASSSPTNPLLLTDNMAGSAGAAGLLYLLPPCGSGFSLTPPFVNCSSPGDAAWILEFCSPGTETLTLSLTTASVAATLTGFLVQKLPGVSEITTVVDISKQLYAKVPLFKTAVDCAAKGPSAANAACIGSTLLELAFNTNQRAQTLAILAADDITVGIPALLEALLRVPLDAEEMFGDWITYNIQTQSVGHLGTEVIKLEGQ